MIRDDALIAVWKMWDGFGFSYPTYGYFFEGYEDELQDTTRIEVTYYEPR